MQVSLRKFMSFSTAEQYPKLVNGPPVAWARIKTKSATNVSTRGVGSRHEKKGITNNGLRKQFQTSHTIFFFFFFTHLMRR